MRIAACPQCGGPIDHEVGRCPTDGTMITSTDALGSPDTVIPDPRDSAPGPHAPRGFERMALGKQVGKFVLEEVIGRGGMGTVYRARHVELGGRVAVKVLDPRYSASAEIVARFFHEARAAAQIGHPNIVQVLDFSRSDEVGDYIVMELLAGATLADVLDRTPQLREGRLVRMALQICDALGAAHQLGIVHRDLKPANVFLSMQQDKEVVTLMDFGVAKIAEARNVLETVPGAVMGTPQYMSPEQWDGKVLDARADVYALGVVLYQAATGKLPYQGKTFAEIVKVQATTTVVPPREHRFELSPELEAVVLRCLAMDPDARYPTMAEVAADLRRAREAALARRNDGESTGRGAHRPAELGEPPARSPGPSATRWAALALGAALVVVGVALVAGRAARDEPAAAATAGHPVASAVPSANAAAATREAPAPAPTDTPSPAPKSASSEALAPILALDATAPSVGAGGLSAGGGLAAGSDARRAEPEAARHREPGAEGASAPTAPAGSPRPSAPAAARRAPAPAASTAKQPDLLFTE